MALLMFSAIFGCVLSRELAKLPSNTLVLPSNTLVLPSNTLVLPSNRELAKVIHEPRSPKFRFFDERQKELLNEELLKELNLPEVPNAYPVHQTIIVQWYVRETLAKINRKGTRFGEKVDTIRFDNALGHSEEGNTYKLLFTFDLSGVERYSKIFGHDLYFRAPRKILKKHGDPAYFHVSVWEDDRLLNSSIIAPVAGTDYKIVIDSLSNAIVRYNNVVNLVVDMGCSIHGLAGHQERSNASIATYGFMPPAKINPNAIFKRRHIRSTSRKSCCKLKHFHQRTAAVFSGEDDVTVLEPKRMAGNTCVLTKEYRQQHPHKRCRISEHQSLAVLTYNSRTNALETRYLRDAIGSACTCD